MPLVLCVTIHVRNEAIESFRVASLANASASCAERGCLQFDVLQHQEDPTQFAFYEVYRDAVALEEHRQTPHYLAWRSAVADMMAQPRVGTIYHRCEM